MRSNIACSADPPFENSLRSIHNEILSMPIFRLFRNPDAIKLGRVFIMAFSDKVARVFLRFQAAPVSIDAF